MSRLSIYFLAVAVSLLVFALLQLSPLRLAENYYEDFLVTSQRADQGVADRIVVIEVRESTLAGFPYRSPLDRGFLAELIVKLVDSEARAIGIDILIDQPSEALKDQKLTEVLQTVGDSVFVPRMLPEDGLTEKQNDYHREFVAPLQTANIVFGKDRIDGVVRHYLSDRQVEGERQQQLAAAMAGTALNREPGSFERILYHSAQSGKPFEFATYPAEAALLLPGVWFRDKYVLIGQNLKGTDQFRTPYSSILGEGFGTLPGVQVHAQVLHQLLSGENITETGWQIKLLAILIASLAGILLARLRTEVWLRSALIVLSGISLLVAGHLVFSSFLALLPMAAATLGLILSSALMSGLIWQRDRTQKRFVRDAWSHYVSENVVDTLIENPGTLKPGGQRIEATYIFTDIEGFTSLSEELSPETLADTINEYLDMMTEEFRSFGATIDKIVGDAVVGFMGAPLADDEHANKAVSLALELVRKSNDFRSEMRKRNIKWGKTRIGINTGHAVVGNFGGSHFFDYTALGDSVNIASRLENANKLTGGSVCVSAETANRAKQHIFRPVGRLYLQGKSNAVEAFEPMIEGNMDLSFEDYLAAYALLEDRTSAKKAFRALAGKFPSDHLVQFHLDRLERGESGTETGLEK